MRNHFTSFFAAKNRLHENSRLIGNLSNRNEKVLNGVYKQITIVGGVMVGGDIGYMNCIGVFFYFVYQRLTMVDGRSYIVKSGLYAQDRFFGQGLCQCFKRECGAVLVKLGQELLFCYVRKPFGAFAKQIIQIFKFRRRFLFHFPYTSYIARH